MLAFEVYPPARSVVGLLARAGKRPAGQADAVDGLATCCGVDRPAVDLLPRSVAQGPPPQAPPARRSFADLAASRLGRGTWRLATDWADYAAQMARCWMPTRSSTTSATRDRLAERHADRRSPASSSADSTPVGTDRDLPTDAMSTLTRLWSRETSLATRHRVRRRRVRRLGQPAGPAHGAGRARAVAAAGLRLAAPIRLVCAGRTDAGVHARGQVAHVDLPAAALDRPCLLRRLRRALPGDLAVMAIQPAPPDSTPASPRSGGVMLPDRRTADIARSAARHRVPMLDREP